MSEAKRNKAWAEQVCQRFSFDIAFARVLLKALPLAKSSGVPFSEALQRSQASDL